MRKDHDSKSGRYLLYLDILGFREMVRNRDGREIYTILDDALNSFDRWERLNGDFKTIYFSDTILFYQRVNGYHSKAFHDAYAIGAMLLSAILGKGIPARGSITFGQFEVHEDSKKKHNVYFGNALIEAYDTAQRENWIGIAIQESAWRMHEDYDPGSISAFESEGVWRKRDDGVLLLNPFQRIKGWYLHNIIEPIDVPFSNWDAPEFPNAVRGFRFLLDQAEKFSRNGDYSSPVAVKYHSTVAFLRHILGAECFEWAYSVSCNLSK